MATASIPATFGLLILCSMKPICRAIDTSWSDSLVYPTYTVNVRDFGAVGDGETNDTGSITKAIQHVSSSIDPETSIKGGIVHFSAGQYLTGHLQLLSNSFLHLDKLATIYASTNPSDYPPDQSNWVVIASYNASNIGIFGDGNINGQNHKYIVEYNMTQNKYIPASWRPRLIELVHSANITLKGSFGLLDSPNFSSHYINCSNVLIDGIHIWNDRLWPNGDGIDPTNTQNVIIRNVNINTGDDSISCSTNYAEPPTSNVLVENAFISSHSSALKFGSGTQGKMYDIVFRNITIVDSNRGLGIMMRDAGSISGVVYENIHIETRWWDDDCNAWWGAGEPIWVTAVQRTASQNYIGSVSNITYRNISIRSENGIFISGMGDPLVAVHNITLQNVSMILDDWDMLYQHPVIDYRPSYAEYAVCVNSSVDAIRLQDVQNVNIVNMNVTFIKGDRQSFWNECIGKDGQTDNIVVTDFHCKN